jgi:CheY-like chemotaxis protein
VDDEEMVGETAKIVLERQGHIGGVAQEGGRALKNFCADPDKFDVVITDLTMPR